MRMDCWNTYDVRCFNAVTRGPELLEARLAFYDEENKLYQDEFLLSEMRRLGPHSLDGGYFDLDIAFGEELFTVTFACVEDSFIYKIQPKAERSEAKLFLAVLFRWGAEGCISVSGGKITANTDKGSYFFDSVSDPERGVRASVSHQGVFYRLDGPLYLRCNNSMSAEEAEVFIACKRAECLASLSRSAGWLEGAAEAITESIIWNTIYDPTKNRLCTPVSRKWCLKNGKAFGSYVLFGWDTFFNGLLAAVQDKELSEIQIDSILDEIPDTGVIPNYGSERGASSDRSEPPVGSYCALKLYRQFGDKRLLERGYERLLRANRWWPERRDPNGDGLLELGSDYVAEVKRRDTHNNNLQAAKYESGLDDSPMYDNAVFNEKTSTMEQSDIGITALFALDCRALAEIARILGKSEDAKLLTADYERTGGLINELMWDEADGIYKNRLWDGTLSPSLSPTCFYPMIAGIAPRERAERMVREHLQNPQEFWGEYILPCSQKNGPGFFDQKFWRGRVWAPMNFLVGEGLRQYGMDDVSFELSEKSLALFMDEWMKYSHVHENYNSITGGGDDDRSDPFYTWGALLAYLAVGEVADADAWEGISFGNLSGKPAVLENIPFAGGLYTVETGERLTVTRAGEPFIRTSMPAKVSRVRTEGDMLSLALVSRGKGEIIISPGKGIKSVRLEYGGKQNTVPVESGRAAFII